MIKYSLSENIHNKKNIEKLAKYIAKIHTHNIEQNNLKIYNAQWVIEQICKTDYIKYKEYIVSALNTMSQVEYHNNLTLKENKFLTWDISNSDWHKDYKSGNAGSCAWDVASIINYVNDSLFSEIFLESYLRYGGEKLTLSAIYANLYYVKVIEAIKNKDFDNILVITKEIINDNIFQTDIISYETLKRLNIIGY